MRLSIAKITIVRNMQHKATFKSQTEAVSLYGEARQTWDTPKMANGTVVLHLHVKSPMGLWAATEK